MDEVTIYHLEMRSPDQLLPARDRSDDLELRECEVRQFELNRFLYQWVGQDWAWEDKLAWQISAQDIQKVLVFSLEAYSI